jgi:hypothetical protein
MDNLLQQEIFNYTKLYWHLENQRNNLGQLPHKKKEKKKEKNYTTYIICENVENNKPMKMDRMGIECGFE